MLLPLLAMLAAASTAPAPPAATYDIQVRLTHAGLVEQPHLRAQSGETAGFLVSPGPAEGWALKVLPTSEGARVRLALDMVAWRREGGAVDRRRALSEVTIAPGETVTLELPPDADHPAFHAEVTAKPA